MQHPVCSEIGRNSIICVDSYEEGVLQGRLYSPVQDMECFASLCQFLLKMETLLNLQQVDEPIAEIYTGTDRSPKAQQVWNRMPERRGHKATFELQILFRHHTSWQGILHRVGETVQHQFRSVLELVVLLDSALNSQKESRYYGMLPGKQEQPPAV